MKTKNTVLKIFNSYLPYNLEIEAEYYLEKLTLSSVSFYDESLFFKNDDDWCDVSEAKPVLKSMDSLTKEELYKAGFEDHVDWLTNERENWINKYGIEGYINQTPYGHIQYLLSKHYNIFGLEESEYIKKETLSK